MKHGNRYIKNLVLSAMFLALGIVLPFVTGQVPQVGSMLQKTGFTSKTKLAAMVMSKRLIVNGF